MIEINIRGLNTHNIEGCLHDEDVELLLSRNAVSKLSRKPWAENEEFVASDLNDQEVEYL